MTAGSSTSSPPKAPSVSGSMLFSFVRCPHRPVMDAFGPQERKDPPNEFVSLLWECGSAHEAQIAASLTGTANVRDLPPEQREQATLDAMDAGVSMIYGGRLRDPNTGEVGEPDLLKKHAGGGYIPGDIKSGGSLDDDGQPAIRPDYVVQIGHYLKLLANIGRAAPGARSGFIIDGDGREVPYELDQVRGVRNTQTWWEFYQEQEAQLRAALAAPDTSLPARAAGCKLCPWKTVCWERVEAMDDLTQIAELGRAKRDAMAPHVPTVEALASIDLSRLVSGRKTAIAGVGPETLARMKERAILLKTPGATPYLREALTLPACDYEVYFDIEADPTRDLVYLHGFVERDRRQSGFGEFKPVLVEGLTPADEQAGFAAAWAYLQACASRGWTIFYYSAYEKTAYRALARKYPGVCSEAEVRDLFVLPNVIDLYSDVVRKKTEWPTNDMSIKTLAVYLGFKWRDPNPSGAASIEWFNAWVHGRDDKLKQRILTYNHDDCIATGVVVDGVRGLQMRP